MKTIKELFFGDQTDNLIKAAKQIYQIEEFDGKLWLTYNGALICPTDMFSVEALKALAEIRELYVKRNTNHKGNEE